MGRIVKMILNAIFSHVGLTILVSIYCISGAFVFRMIEGDVEEDGFNRTIQFAIKLEQTDFKQEAIDEISAAGKNNDLDALTNAFEKYHARFAEGAQNFSYKGKIPDEESHVYGWSIQSAILFAASILTTIGYGHVSPQTKTGQMTVIIYALFAIPLMTMFISNIGQLSSNGIRYMYGRVRDKCCRKKEDPNEVKSFNEKKGGVSKHQPVPVLVTGAIVIIYLLIGILVFSLVEEEWGVIGCIYFCFISVLTIGFGDLVPGVSNAGTKGIITTVASAIYIIIGLAVLATGAELMLQSLHVYGAKIAKRRRELKGKKEKSWENDEYEGKEGSL